MTDAQVIAVMLAALGVTAGSVVLLQAKKHNDKAKAALKTLKVMDCIMKLNWFLVKIKMREFTKRCRYET